MICQGVTVGAGATITGRAGQVSLVGRREPIFYDRVCDGLGITLDIDL